MNPSQRHPRPPRSNQTTAPELQPHPPASQDLPAGAVIIGVLVAIRADGCPLVSFAGNPETMPAVAQATVQLAAADIGRRVALLFEGGRLQRPIVVGCLLPSTVAPGPASDTSLQAEVDDETVTLVAQRKLVLRCGQASITLSADGGVEIKGTELVSRASAANRIRGASVHLN